MGWLLNGLLFGWDEGCVDGCKLGWHGSCWEVIDEASQKLDLLVDIWLG